MEKKFFYMEILYLLAFYFIWAVSLFVELNPLLLLISVTIEFILIYLQNVKIVDKFYGKNKNALRIISIVVVAFFVTVSVGEYFFQMEFIYPRKRLIDNIFIALIYPIVERLYLLCNLGIKGVNEN